MDASSPVQLPRIEPLGGNRYRLVEDYVYEWTHGDERYRLVVSTGFENDLASVPRFLWWYISPFDLGAAAVPHDWIYRHGGRLPVGSQSRWADGHWRDVPEPWTRRNADRLFARMMRESGVSRVKRRSAFLAVRVFGRSAWRDR